MILTKLDVFLYYSMMVCCDQWSLAYAVTVWVHIYYIHAGWWTSLLHWLTSTPSLSLSLSLSLLGLLIPQDTRFKLGQIVTVAFKCSHEKKTLFKFTSWKLLNSVKNVLPEPRWTSCTHWPSYGWRRKVTGGNGSAIPMCRMSLSFWHASYNSHSQSLSALAEAKRWPCLILRRLREARKLQKKTTKTDWQPDLLLRFQERHGAARQSSKRCHGRRYELESRVST